MMSAKRLVVAGVLALAGLALSADKASAQFGYYNYGYNPYVGVGGVYNPYALNAVNPYGVGVYGAGLPYYNYQTRYYSNPFYGTGVYNSYYQSPSVFGPGGYQYNYWRWR